MPAWFPGYRNHIDAANIIHINPATFHRFLGLDKRKIAWIYSFFFTRASITASKKYPTASRSGTYPQFTAPWYKGDFDAGPGHYYKLNVTEVIAKRAMRSSTGHNRMQLTLAGFYDHESHFCKDALDYILLHLDVLILRFPFARKRSRPVRRTAPPPNPDPHVVNDSTLPLAPENDEHMVLSGYESGEPETAAQAAGLT